MADCPKCGGSMVEGFIIDQGDYSTSNLAFWHEGAPDKRWWGLKVDKAKMLRMTTSRCRRCGYLESFAR